MREVNDGGECVTLEQPQHIAGTHRMFVTASASAEADQFTDGLTIWSLNAVDAVIGTE
jgi:hypothetical protein